MNQRLFQPLQKIQTQLDLSILLALKSAVQTVYGSFIYYTEQLTVSQASCASIETVTVLLFILLYLKQSSSLDLCSHEA